MLVIQEKVSTFTKGGINTNTITDYIRKLNQYSKLLKMNII